MAFTRPSISGSKAAWQRSSAAEHAPADRNPAPEASPGGLQNTDLSGGVGAGSTIVVQASTPSHMCCFTTPIFYRFMLQLSAINL